MNREYIIINTKGETFKDQQGNIKRMTKSECWDTIGIYEIEKCFICKIETVLD